MAIENKVNRRSVLGYSALAAVAFPMINTGAFKVFAASDMIYSTRTIDLVRSTQVFDMLSVLSPLGQVMMALFGEHPKQADTFKISQEQLTKILSSGIDVFHPAFGIGEDGAASFIARLNGLVGDHPNHLRRIDSLNDLADLKKGERVGFVIGIQNSEHFKEADDVNHYYNLGQRISQLTYNSRNLIGTGSTDRSDGGLSDFGVSIVERMNEVGMAIDVSHCGDRTTLDAFAISKKPVLITHSNVRTLAGGHIRCKPDEAILAMAQAGSVMGITGVRQFVSDKEPTTIENIVDHVDYIANLVGIEHVGVGSDIDLDGYDDIPEPAYSALKAGYKSNYAFRDKLDTDGYDHPKRIYDLTESLFNRNYSEENIRLILGDNFKRVLGKIWHA